MRATEIAALGYADLVSVIPPDARLAAGSAIRPEAKGKSPGVRYASGAWGGYDWQRTPVAAAEMDACGASVGLRADRFPAVDVDVTDETLAAVVANVVERVLPTGPMRVGAWPKRLYAFRLEPGAHPISRLQLFILHGDTRHLVEILGAGQQYVVSGTHPKTGQPYEWRRPLVKSEELPTLTLDQARALLDAIADELDILGLECVRSGTGATALRSEVSQESLKAHDLSVLSDAVASVPNSDSMFASREDYIRFGYAIKAASQADPGRGLEIYQEWAARWTGGVNDPEVVAADWDRMRGPYSVGADYVFDLAQQHGFNLAEREFPRIDPAPPTHQDEEARPESRYSDMWLADQFVRRFGGVVRWVERWGAWMVYDRVSWTRDNKGLVAEKIKRVCIETANAVARTGATAAEVRQNQALAKALSSGRTFDAVLKLARIDARVSAVPAEFDNELDLVATPGGVFDLRTGAQVEASPSQMLTKRTRVTPSRGPCPLWHKFLNHATGGDVQLRDYLQKLMGYCLTGHTREQKIFFFQGPGGRGKGTFLNLMGDLFGELSATTNMTTFTASKQDRHTTELAALYGARMVQAQEVQGERMWDEQRLKSLSGGDPVTARFLFQNEFTYTPKFKLVFSGNYRPHFQSADPAMRRRMRLIPFITEVLEKDVNLPLDLRRAEMPAIMYWVLEGAVKYYAEGLAEPSAVTNATEGYFWDEDAIGRWMRESCSVGGDGRSPASDLFDSWSAWCMREGEPCGTPKRFSAELSARGYNKLKSNGKMVYSGLQLGVQKVAVN